MRCRSVNQLCCTLSVLIAYASSASAAAAPVKETLPAGMKIVELSAQPATIEFKHKYQYAQVLISGKLESGEVVDVMRMLDSASVSNDVATVSPTGVVRPKADGQGQAQFTLGDKSVSVAVTVSGVAVDYKPSFVRDVMPTLSKLGCNAGTCHGSLNGKNGFKLSLRGYDPLFDHRALTDDIASRRINRAAPDQSLMLLKPAGVIPHVGGVVMQPGEPYYELIRAWIANGLQLDLDAPRVAKIEILPKNPVVPLPGMTQQMQVIATYADGAVRDVTLEAFIESGNSEVAENNKLGLTTMVRRGEAPVLARFEGAYTATTITVMGDRSGFAWKALPANNFVDELVYKKLERVKALPSELCGDAEFIRRVYIDLVGMPPLPEEVRAFLADSRETKLKRDELIDRLIGSPDFVDYWTNKWGDMLQVNRKFLGAEGAEALRNWIKQAVATNMPYDKFVYAVITASGSTMQNPPAAYFKILRTPEETMENSTQLFLAVRFNCNKCHDHPFERWTQGQYYHLAAYFAHVGRKDDPASGDRKIGGTDVEAPKALIEEIFDTGTGEVMHIGTGKVAEPSFPYQHADLAPPTASRREQLAKWITSKDNQYFAKSYVNRLWGYLFGKGIIEPIDDIRAGNPATNPELLQRLAEEFIANGFNSREILRLICKSRTYQQSIVTNQWNQDDDINFSHAIARRLPAEALYDAVQRATGAESHLPGVPAGARAAQLPDVGLTLPSGFFEQFGRPARESSCECERSSGMMLGPVMALVNGPTIADAINDGNNALTKLVASQSDDAKVVEELFVRILCREPTQAEIAAGVDALRNVNDEAAKAVADLAAYEKELDAKQPAWEATQSAVVWTPLDPSETKSTAGATLTKQPDLSILADGPNAKDLYTVVASTDLVGITGVRLEALTDPKLPNKGPGRPPNGNFVLSEFKVMAASKADPSKSGPVMLQNPAADFSQEGFPINNAIDNNPGTGWAIDPRGGNDHVAIFETNQDVNYPGGTLLTFTLDQQHVDNLHQLGKFRLSVTTSQRPLRLNGPPANIAPILVTPADQRTPDQKAEIARHFRAMDPQWVRLKQVNDAATAITNNKRLAGAQDLAWALINSPSFLFNR